MKHPSHVEGFEGTLEELAKRIGNMKYDAVRDFVDAIAKDIRRQADGDSWGNRPRLAKQHYETAAYLESARDALGAAWTICEQYMNEKKETRENL